MERRSGDLKTSPKLLETFPELYLYGLSTSDFREALKILLGKKAVLSPSSIIRLKEYWFQAYLSFHKKRLDSHYAYIFADGVYIPRGKGEKLAILVVIGVDSEGRKRLLAKAYGIRSLVKTYPELNIPWVIPQFIGIIKTGKIYFP